MHVCRPLNQKKAQRLEIALSSENSQNAHNMEIENRTKVIENTKEDDFFDVSLDSISESDHSIFLRKLVGPTVKNYFAEGAYEKHQCPLRNGVFVKVDTPISSSGPVERMFSYDQLTEIA